MIQADGTTDPGAPASAAAFTVADRAVMLGASLWVLSVVFFVGQAIAEADARPYSIATNLISDLGNTACRPDLCSPLHTFVNATFVAAGACHGLGAVATRKAWPNQPLGAIAAVPLAVAGAGLIVAGLAPENLNPAIHAFGAMVGLVSLNLGMIVIGALTWAASRRLSILTRAAGIAGFIGLGMFLSGGAGLPVGIAERLADYPGAAMVLVLGAYLLVVALRPDRREATAP